jgi:hypothetical protein
VIGCGSRIFIAQRFERGFALFEKSHDRSYLLSGCIASRDDALPHATLGFEPFVPIGVSHLRRALIHVLHGYDERVFARPIARRVAPLYGLVDAARDGEHDGDCVREVERSLVSDCFYRYDKIAGVQITHAQPVGFGSEDERGAFVYSTLAQFERSEIASRMRSGTRLAARCDERCEAFFEFFEALSRFDRIEDAHAAAGDDRIDVYGIENGSYDDERPGFKRCHDSTDRCYVDGVEGFDEDDGRHKVAARYQLLCVVAFGCSVKSFVRRRSDTTPHLVWRTIMIKKPVYKKGYW